MPIANRSESTLRKPVLVVAIAVALVAAFSPATAPATRAAGGPKVAIIVGATHSATSQYRTYANQVYAEAIKYTSNVVRVYSPNATWTAVKNAVNGASIVVYMGHGNGWPSPYTYDPNYTTKDGFGLNAAAGQGDNNVKYYGEPSVRTLTPAPNAVVILMHLCYASGNSEPGQAAPSLTVARQRVDNYGAGFLRSNVRAVIADGHAWDHGYYIRALFTTRQTIDEVWRNAPNFHDNVLTYASSRTPGYTYQMDPDSPTSGYYRSIVGKMSLTTTQVTGSAYAVTDTDPSSFVVPGAASAKLEGAPVYGDAGTLAAGGAPLTTLPLDTRVRLDADLGTAPDGSKLLAVHTLDGAVEGVMAGSSLTPRDSQGPRTWDAEDGTSAFSPNGDGSQDRYQLAVDLSESAAWTLRIRDGDTTLASASGTGKAATIDWDGRHGGSTVADGSYAWQIEAADGWGNAPLADGGTLHVDTVAPTLGGAGLAADAGPAASLASEASPRITFSPNGDGKVDTMSLGVTADEPATIEAIVRNAGGTAVADVGAGAPTGSATLTWDGRTTSGGLAADGLYALEVRARDAAGNRSPATTTLIGVHKALANLRTASINFWPNDNDAYANAMTVAFDLLANQTVSFRIVDANGSTVKTIHDGTSLAAGGHRFSWNGRGEAGTYLPRGLYRAVVTATNGTLTSQLTTPFVQDAFKINASDTTPARGQAITVTIVSAEPLSKSPRLTVYEPGRSAWAVTFSLVSGRTYKATIRLHTGATGTLTLRASGYDASGDYDASLLKLPLH